MAIRAKVQHQDEGVKCVADQIEALADDLPMRWQITRATKSATRSTGQKVFIKVEADKEQTTLLNQLKTLLQTHTGTLPVVLYYARSNKSLALKAEYNVKPSPQLTREIETLFGIGSIRVK